MRYEKEKLRDVFSYGGGKGVIINVNKELRRLFDEENDVYWLMRREEAVLRGFSADVLGSEHPMSKNYASLYTEDNYRRHLQYTEELLDATLSRYFNHHKIDREKSLLSVMRVDRLGRTLAEMMAVLNEFATPGTYRPDHFVDLTFTDQAGRAVPLEGVNYRLFDYLGRSDGKLCGISGVHNWDYVFLTEESRKIFDESLLGIMNKIVNGNLWLSDEIRGEFGRLRAIFFHHRSSMGFANKPKNPDYGGYLLLGLAELAHVRDATLSEKLLAGVVSVFPHELDHLLNFRLAGDRPISPSIFEFSAFREQVETIHRNFPVVSLPIIEAGLAVYSKVILGENLVGDERPHFCGAFYNFFEDLMQKLDYERRVFLVERIVKLTGSELV